MIKSLALLHRTYLHFIRLSLSDGILFKKNIYLLNQIVTNYFSRTIKLLLTTLTNQRFSGLGKGLLALMLIGTFNAAAEGNDPPKSKQVQPIRTDTPPIIDGKLDDAVWSQASVVNELHEVFPFEFDPPSQETEFYLLYDKDALYVGVRVLESDPSTITAQNLKQGTETLFHDDFIAIMLDPFHDRRSGYKFLTNPNGVRAESLFVNTTEQIFDWDGIWETKSVITDEGWTTELAIPFKTLSFDKADNTWGVNFQRNIAWNRELIAWESRNRVSNPSASGILTGMTELDQGKGLDIVPGVSVRRSRKFETEDEEFVIEPSLDVFYKITEGLNGSLSINTDFAATEVDSRQVNLTRFNLFFPEKRDFFLKDNDIFDFGGIGGTDGQTNLSRVERENAKPLFTRRIGLSSTGEPVDLEYSGKISGRVGQWNIGSFFTRQGEFKGEDATDIVVARVTRNIFNESIVGGIITHGDPTSSNDNSLYGIDYQYLNSRFIGNKTLRANFWYQKSIKKGVSGDDQAFGFNVKIPSASTYRGQIAFKEVQENFDPALGFINRRGIRDYQIQGAYAFRPRNSYLRKIQTGIEARRVDRIDGGLQSELIELRAIELQNNTDEQFEYNLLFQKERLIEPFEISKGITLPTGNYNFTTSKIVIATGQQRKLRGAILIHAGSFYNGDQLNFRPRITWRPSKHFKFDITYDFNDIDLDQGDFIVRNTSFESAFVFSSTLSWVNLFQYDSVSDVIGFNSRIHWTPKAGNDLFFVVNHKVQEFDNSGKFESISQDITLKLNYTYRF